MLTRLDLDAYQVNAIQFCGTGEDTLLVADVGTGKTVIALTAGQDAIYSGEVHRWLVVAPKLVATDTWAKEPELWEHLQDMDVRIACGTPEQRRDAICSTAQFVVINYENLSWLMDEYPRKGQADPLPFDGLICDEIDKLKSVSSNRFKDFRNRIKKFNKRIGLTGTLVPNELTEAWGQTYMVDGGETFGRSFYSWRKKYFYPIDYKQYDWVPLPGTRDYMLDALNGLAFRIEAEGLPRVIAHEPTELQLPDSVTDMYRELEREYYLIVEDCQGEPREVEAVNTAVLKGKLQQMCAGFSYVDGGKDAVWHSYDRFVWLLDLFGRLNRQLLVFYHFNEERDELLRRFPNCALLQGGDNAKRATIDAWNAGKLDMLALHPASAGHGLNLQKSGAHDIAFLTIPWSGGMFKQVTGRLARRGQVADHVNVWTALNVQTVDYDVFATVTDKLDTMQDFQDALHEQQAGTSD